MTSPQGSDLAGGPLAKLARANEHLAAFDGECARFLRHQSRTDSRAARATPKAGALWTPSTSTFSKHRQSVSLVSSETF